MKNKKCLTFQKMWQKIRQIKSRRRKGVEFRRHVDDTFALFNTEQDALSFFSYIHSQHPNIKFTMDREENHKLPLSDVILI